MGPGLSSYEGSSFTERHYHCDTTNLENLLERDERVKALDGLYIGLYYTTLRKKKQKYFKNVLDKIHQIKDSSEYIMIT